MCITFHPKLPSVIAGGTFNGMNLDIPQVSRTVLYIAVADPPLKK